jgi:uncharacterized membrane-anchored protein YjiN (DUF445 family)
VLVRRSRLARLRLIATGLLVLMAAILIGSVLWQARFPWLAWVEAFAEAGLVGGLADWFAVTALFRRPLGLPFPHTAIIPRNKDRIGAELGSFVERNFLTPENLTSRLRGLDLAGLAVRWAARPANAARLAAALRQALPAVVAALDEVPIEQMIAALLVKRLKSLDMAGLTATGIDLLVASGRHQQLLDQGLAEAAIWVERNRGELGRRLGNDGSWRPRFVDAYIADRFADAAVALIDEIIAAPSHEIRSSFDRAATDFADRLRHDPAIRGAAGGLQQALLDRLEPEPLAASLWGAVKNAMIGETDHRLDHAIAALARSLRRDRPLLDRLNATILDAVPVLIGRFRSPFASVIADVVRGWDAKSVAHAIETELGADLQFIRLNGTLVGGLAGLAIHALLLLVQR